LCSVATWYACGAGEPVRGLLAGAAGVVTISAVACLATRRRWPAFAVYSGAVVVFLAWWATISPGSNRNWAPDVARNLTATIDGNRVVLSNVRNFACAAKRTSIRFGRSGPSTSRASAMSI
jgi:hypothetical protein